MPWKNWSGFNRLHGGYNRLLKIVNRILEVVLLTIYLQNSLAFYNWIWYYIVSRRAVGMARQRWTTNILLCKCSLIIEYWSVIWGFRRFPDCNDNTAHMDKLKLSAKTYYKMEWGKNMIISIFDPKVENVRINELSVTLNIEDGKGNTVTLFFNSIDEARDFSKAARRAVMDEANKQWARFKRPALITDK